MNQVFLAIVVKIPGLKFTIPTRFADLLCRTFERRRHLVFERSRRSHPWCMIPKSGYRFSEKIMLR